MDNMSTRQASLRYLRAQSLFLEVNGSRDKRLISYQSNPRHNKSYALQLTQELEADLSFYCESQREVERLLEEINKLKMQLLMQQMEAKLDKSIIQDFVKGKQLDVELTAFYVDKLQPKLKGQSNKAA